jgi:hypothetical protein
MDSDKYNRHQTMYADPDVPLSAKWRQAVEFYRQDLADGFVRINHELMILSYTNSEIREQVHARVNRWQALLLEVAEEHFPRLGIDLPREMTINALVNFWWGMEARQFAGFGEEHGQFFETLDTVGDWLEERERKVAAGEVKPIKI